MNTLPKIVLVFRQYYGQNKMNLCISIGYYRQQPRQTINLKHNL